MKITDIKQQVKRAGRYSIFIDGKYSFSLSENELLNIGLRINQEYTKEEFEKLKQTAVLDKAYMRCLDLLARRARSDWEIRDYLKRKDYDGEVSKKTIERLSTAGYIDDEKFANSWVENRRLLKATSKRKLKMELKQKRIDEQTIDKVLEQDETDERQVLKDLIEKKRGQTRYQDEQKLIAYLMRQGFNYQDIKDVLE